MVSHHVIAFAGRKLWRTLANAARNRYRPERHYMRGPGPKWQAKHGDARLAGVGISARAPKRLPRERQ